MRSGTGPSAYIDEGKKYIQGCYLLGKRVSESHRTCIITNKKQTPMTGIRREMMLDNVTQNGYTQVLQKRKEKITNERNNK